MQALGGWPANSDHKNVHLDPRLTALRQVARRAIVSQKTQEITTARQDFGACHVLPASSRVLTAPAVMTVMLGRTASWEFALRVTQAKRRVLDSLLAGGSALAVFPTGGGKSLCYQLPALIMPGTTIVVLPSLRFTKTVRKWIY